MRNTSIDRAHSRGFWLTIVFLTAHAPLAVAMKLNPLVSTVHCLATIAIGLIVVLLRGGSERVAYVAAYVVGAEVLWRMTKAAAAWETGKYAVILFLFLGILRSGRWRIAVIPLLYIALMIPSTIAVVLDQGVASTREIIAFNLSGPASLAICAWYFTRLSISRRELTTTAFVLTGPIIGIGFAAYHGIATSSHVVFGTESNFQTSGGYGPNQVSSILGLGAMVILLVVITVLHNRRWQLLLVALATWLAAQCALTFSRGGLYNLGAGTVIAVTCLLNDTHRRVQIVVAVVALVLISGMLVYPALNNFTGGKLGQRFADTGTSNRAEIMEGDLELWHSHFVLGVGPGQAPEMRSVSRGTAAHTELTRVLAEHGLLGLTGLILLFGLAFSTVLRAPTPEAKAWSAAFFGWALLYMLNAAMRTAAPGFIFGLACAHLCTPDREPPRAVACQANA